MAETKEKEMSLNKKMNVFKLVMSSLFARKLNYLVLNTEEDKNRFIFTNIPEERVPFYQSDIDDQLSVVKVSDSVTDIVYELFPTLKGVTAIIVLPTFLSTINKLMAEKKGEVPQIYVDMTSMTLKMDIPTNKADLVLAVEGEDEASQHDGTRVVIGRLIAPVIVDKYLAIVKNFESVIKEPIEREVAIPEGFWNDRMTLLKMDLTHPYAESKLEFNLPIQDGLNIVSFREYLTKRKLPWKVMTRLFYDEKSNVVKVMYGFHDDMVDVLSLSPGAIWFPYLTQQ